jgi:hypothetical protein
MRGPASQRSAAALEAGFARGGLESTVEGTNPAGQARYAPANGASVSNPGAVQAPPAGSQPSQNDQPRADNVGQQVLSRANFAFVVSPDQFSCYAVFLAVSVQDC